MNKLASILAIFLLTGINTMAQLQKVDLPELKKVGSTKYMGELVAELSYTLTSKDTTYSLLFRNQKYTSLVDLVRVDFENSPGILDSLYATFNNGFDIEKGKQSTFYLGKDFIAVSSDKAMGMKFIQVMALDKNAYFYLRKKQLNELFNKK